MVRAGRERRWARRLRARAPDAAPVRPSCRPSLQDLRLKVAAVAVSVPPLKLVASDMKTTYWPSALTECRGNWLEPFGVVSPE